ncbi:MAG: site-2 protease family protein [Chloroflexota bacterium]
MDNFSENQELITRLVTRIMKIDSVTSFEPGSREIAVFRGRLIKDSIAAYDQIAEALKPHKLTPLFREENDQHVVALLDGVAEVKPSNPMVNLVLFLFTLLSVIWVGALYSYEGPFPEDLGLQIELIFSIIKTGLPYGLSILAILLAHEFGHYLAARYHQADVTLPYFIPFPFSSFGTMGAFIQLKTPPKNKRILHDIGVAGPLAGLFVAIPILLIGLSLSPVTEISVSTLPEGSILTVEGNSIIYLVSKYIVHGELLPAPQDYGGVAPLWYWIRYMFTGHPSPIGGRDVMLHPMAWAGWAGLLVTALNLLPVGQLDGGHALYVLVGKKALGVFPYILGVLALLGLVWPGWWLWMFLIYRFGQRHAEPLDQITELDSRRQMIAIFVLILFVLLFTPIPLTQYADAGVLF